MTIKQFEQAYHNHACGKTSLPPAYVPRTKFTDKTANGLTKLVITFLTYHGHQAERISTTGRYLQGRSVARGFYGNVNVKGKYIPGTGTKGSSDISATINGLSIKIEIKMKDRQSPDQVKYQQSIESAGGKYFIVRSFDEFIGFYQSLV